MLCILRKTRQITISVVGMFWKDWCFRPCFSLGLSVEEHRLHGSRDEPTKTYKDLNIQGAECAGYDYTISASSLLFDFNIREYVGHFASCLTRGWIRFACINLIYKMYIQFFELHFSYAHVIRCLLLRVVWMINHSCHHRACQPLDVRAV